MEKIAWIGLGTMGVPMARNAAEKGFHVTAYNRTPKSPDVGGAKVADSVAATVEGATVVCIMVSDGAAVEDVLFGSGNVAAQVDRGTVVVNMSTIGVEETKNFALRLADLGLEWVDAPVSGSVGPARDGTLVFMVGGMESTYERLKPLFLAMGREAFYLGPVSSGAGMKLLVNAYLGTVVEAVSECMAIADKSGLDRMKYLEVLKQTGMWAPILAAKTPMWRDNEFPQSFALKHMAKDMGLTSQFARSISAATPTLSNTLQVYLSALANDLAEQDMAGVFRETSRLAGNEA